MTNLTKNLLLTIAGAAGLMMSSCGQSGQNANIAFESFSSSNTYSLVGSAIDFDRQIDVICSDSVSIVLPITLDSTKVNKLREAIVNEAFDQKGMPIEKAIHNWFDSKTSETPYQTVEVPGLDDSQAAQGYNIVRGYVVYLSPRILVYCVNKVSMLPGAAHPMAYDRYINYILDGKGTILTLNDLFTAEGQQQLPAMIADQAEKNIEYAGNVSITELPDENNFYISSEGQIVFCYDPMEVGPYSLGSVNVPFYPTELATVMTPQALKAFRLEDLIAE